MAAQIPRGLSRGKEIAKTLKGIYQVRRSQDDEAAAQRASCYVSASLGRLKGLPQKIGQILSLSEEPADSGPYMELTEQGADPLAWDVMRSMIEIELGAPIEALFASFDEIPIAVASLSQVYRAQTHAGEDVAVKVQYPDMQLAIESDLKALGWMSVPFGGMGKQFKLEDYRETFLATLTNELDYNQELSQLEQFRARSVNYPFLQVPMPHPALSSECVLTLSYMEGEHFRDVCQSWDRPQKEVLARKLIALFFNGLLMDGVIHADPHPGNYRFLRGDDIRVLLYDFGCVKQISISEREGISELIGSVIRGQGRYLEALVKIGFNPAEIFPVRDKLEAVMQVLFAPFVDDLPFDVSKWERGSAIDAILGADKWALRTSAPASFLFVMRGFQGLLYYLKHLRVAVSWREAINASFEISTQPDETGLAVLEELMATAGARNLCILVQDGGMDKVRLYMPSDCARRLIETVPPDVQEKLPEHGIDLLAIENKLNTQDCLAPQEIFEVNLGAKQIRVWLE